ncbi:MAG: hypothetical protein KGJ79_06025 [Alphaproteobacteria bacterium]|nr:hypothetical protein [Alphaproteobacteria bacterium]MDE2110679.1 hypothetical protein [Alphaproteobacteria bacterium]
MAGSGSEYGKAAGAARQFYFRNRTLLLSIVFSILGVVTGAATALAILSGASLRGAALIVVGALLAGVVAFLHVRHLALAFLVAAAPLPGLAWAAPLSADARFGAVPMLGYAFAYGIAVMLAHDVVVKALDNGKIGKPFKQAALSIVVSAVLAFFWFWRSAGGGGALQAMFDILFSAVSALLLMPVGTSLLHFDEAFVARANRAREHRRRFLEKAAMTAVPRWGLSIAGIALIFVALAWFGAQPALLHIQPAKAVIAGSVGLVFAISYVAYGGWREGLAATVAATLVCLVALWAQFAVARVGLHADVGLPPLAALALFLVFCGLQRAQAHRLLGDDPAIARLRAVEDLGGAQVFAVLGGIAALLPAVAFHAAAVSYSVALLFAAAAAVGFAPALVSATEVLLPRRHSVEELYRRL